MRNRYALFLTFVEITVNIGPVAAQSEYRKNNLWKQCTEPVLVLRLDPAPFAEIVGSDFSLVLEETMRSICFGRLAAAPLGKNKTP